MKNTFIKIFVLICCISCMHSTFASGKGKAERDESKQRQRDEDRATRERIKDDIKERDKKAERTKETIPKKFR